MALWITLSAAAIVAVLIWIGLAVLGRREMARVRRAVERGEITVELIGENDGTSATSGRMP